jgi:hypothetical protein
MARNGWVDQIDLTCELVGVYWLKADSLTLMRDGKRMKQQEISSSWLDTAENESHWANETDEYSENKRFL